MIPDTHRTVRDLFCLGFDHAHNHHEVKESMFRPATQPAYFPKSNWEPIVTGVRRRRYLVSSRMCNTFMALTASTVNVRQHGNYVFSEC
jgi:hypothetical protein